MSFIFPIALLGLLAIPVLVGLYLWHERRRVALQSRFGNPALLPNLVHRRPGRLRHLPVVLFLASVTAMIVGVARPEAIVSVKREEATVVLAIDVSRSMKAEDVEPTRLDAAREAARAFAAEIPVKYRVGVVSFATRAAVAVPPTEDRTLVDAALDSLTPGEGTAIGDAVALSVRVGQRKAEAGAVTPPRTILVISDGARDGGRVEPAEAARQAKAKGIPVHTVLIGTPNGVIEETLTGGFRQIIRVPPSPQTLEQLAAATGGQFFVAPSTEELRRVYEELGSRLGTRDQPREITDVFAAGAAALLFAGGALSVLLFRRVV